MNRNGLLLPITIFIISWAIGHDTPAARAGEPSASAKPESPAKVKVRPVARIVFIGQKQSCDCTKKRIEASWKALHSVNGDGRKLPVTRLDWDVDEKEADRYIKMRSLMVIPGIYFLDGQDKLIDMLQGETTEKQIAAILK
jgi:hypothetical protein